MSKTMQQALDDMLKGVRPCLPKNGDCRTGECCYTVRVVNETTNPTAVQKTWMSILSAKKIPVLKTDKPFSQCDSSDVIAKFPSWDPKKNTYVMDPRTMPKQVYETICSGAQSLGASVIAAVGAVYVATY